MEIENIISLSTNSIQTSSFFGGIQMRKITIYGFLIVFGIFAIISLVRWLFPQDSIQGLISDDVEVNVNTGELVQDIDTHEGFLGDGLTFVELHFSEEDGELILEQIIEGTVWQELPMSSTLHTALYGGSIMGGNRSSLLDNCEQDNFCLPPIPYGYYFFENRNTQAEGPLDQDSLFEVYSFNFTVALYDPLNYTLYYIRFDT